MKGLEICHMVDGLERGSDPGKSSLSHNMDIFIIFKKWQPKTLIICVYLLYLIVLPNFDNTNVVTFPKNENLKFLVTCKLTGSHFETHAFRNIEAFI